MKNTEFNVGSHITVQGHKGIVKEISRCKQVVYSYKGGDEYSGSYPTETIDNMIKDGYDVKCTGKTATYFKVEFVDDLKHTGFNNATYGCIDEYEEYGTW